MKPENPYTITFNSNNTLGSQKFEVNETVFCKGYYNETIIGKIKQYNSQGNYTVTCGITAQFNEVDIKHFDINSVGKEWDDIL